MTTILVVGFIGLLAYYGYKSYKFSANAPRFSGREIICPNPNCGYRGPSRRQARGSTTTGCLLSLLLLVPGIIYFIVRSGYRYVCPKCGLQIGSES